MVEVMNMSMLCSGKMSKLMRMKSKMLMIWFLDFVINTGTKFHEEHEFAAVAAAAAAT